MRYDPATRPCSGGPTRGIKELEAWILRNVAGTTTYGTYNCRSVRGSLAPSMHGSGRAVDIHPVNNNVAIGSQLANLLVAHAETLGIQCVIWNRQIWSSNNPRWRRYYGVNPHTDHLHIEITIPAATFLNQDYIRGVVGGNVTPPATGLAVLREGMRGDAVKNWQLCLVVYTGAKIDIDGVFGPATTEATKHMQTFAKIPADGVVGPRTHQAMAWYMTMKAEADKKAAANKAKVRPQYAKPIKTGPIVSSVVGPNKKGVYLLDSNGSVYAFGGAKYHGGASGKDYFKGRKAAKIRLATAAERKLGIVYVIVATSGETYKYGPKIKS